MDVCNNFYKQLEYSARKRAAWQATVQAIQNQNQQMGKEKPVSNNDPEGLDKIPVQEPPAERSSNGPIKEPEPPEGQEQQIEHDEKSEGVPR